MPGYTVKRLDEMEAAYGGGFLRARAELGVTSFGLQVIRMPPDHRDYPEHDHSADGQEEVYLALKGGGWIDVDGERVELGKDVLVRIPAGTKRKVYSGPEGIEMLVIGGCPGEPYTAPAMSELGAGA